MDLLRAHLAGACCAKCLAAAPGQAGRKLRKRARQLEFRDLSIEDSLDGQVYKLVVKDGKKSIDFAFPLDDLLPEAWLDPLIVGQA